MKNIKITTIINYFLVFYVLVWLYYGAFNWDVFAIQLNTNAGFSVISGYPFVFFFLFGIALLLGIKYFASRHHIMLDKKEKDQRHKVAIMEKDIELLKMKEVLFKMQTSEMTKNSSHLSALQEKLDSLSQQLSSPETENDEQKKEGDESK